MQNKVIINLPSANLRASEEFFIKIGITKDLELSDENALCFTINEVVTLALLPEVHFSDATGGNIANTASEHEVLLSVEKVSESEVDTIVGAALELGAKEIHEPMRVNGLYGRSFSDLDGHQWNFHCKLEA